jgi:hypothetical protein
MNAHRVKAGGVAGLLAAASLVGSAVLYGIAPAEGVIDTPFEYLYRALAVLAYVGAIIAIWGTHALHSGHDRYGRLGAVGSLATVAGYAVIAAVTVISLVYDFEYLLTVRIAGAGVLLVGAALLGIVIIRARLLPWWCGVLLIVAFPLGDVANALYPTAENLLLALLWGSTGAALLRRRPTTASAPQVTQTASVN